MSDALIGCSGFVGASLLRQRSFGGLFNSKNARDITSRSYDLIVCAAAPGEKWIANRNPEADKQNIEELIDVLRNSRCRHFVLISTVDVFAYPVGVDERSKIKLSGLHSYGRHRRELELAVLDFFDRVTIIRLPGLVGPGLKKNVIYDLHHQHETHKINRSSTFQFYPMVNLWSDIRRALQLAEPIVHFATEPIRVDELATECFKGDCLDQLGQPSSPVRYETTTCLAEGLGGHGQYLYDRRAVIMAIRAYVQCEPSKSQACPQPCE
jgi:nucleoside-diphosphate-sugar epimerase